MYIKTDETGRITAISRISHIGPDEFEFDFPEDFDFERQFDYRIEGGALVYDPLPEPAPEPSLNDVIDALLGVEEDA